MIKEYDMNTPSTFKQLAAQVSNGQAGASQDFIRQLQPHMERMLRRALRGAGQSALEVSLRRAAVAANGDLVAAARSLCLDSAARLAPEAADAPYGTQLGGAAWHAATAIA
jgi:hypothetical protein